MNYPSCTSLIATDAICRQHVYRCHILPIKCPGCVQLFESSRLFAHHLHAVPYCDRAVSEADGPSKGLETLLQKIRSPKLTSANTSEEEKWRILYTTLFPKESKDNIPRPCKYSPSPPRFASLFLSHSAIMYVSLPMQHRYREGPRNTRNGFTT